ncbi:unnamed protein product [Cylindrotheca closterium]|uniref:BRCT domain-containing protein n=1 Tax=Cylindrotheca closterium TaxID=2856 RepID=A0AAD2FV49_9STRA|nr:unnamed protein product [Cylindrotheca closterium]
MTKRTVEDLQDVVSTMENAETNLEYFSQWHAIADKRAPSPTGVVDHGTLMERYCRAKQSYHHKRLEGLLVERIGTFDDQKPCHFDFPTVEKDKELEEQREQALGKLQKTVQGIDEQADYLRVSYQSITNKRLELKQMIQDLEEETNDDESKMLIDDDQSGDGNTDSVFDDDIVAEQENIEELQRKKIQLQQQLSTIRKEREQLENTTKEKQRNLVLLHQETAGLDKEKLEARVQELKEIKSFYDSLREVLEELGGIKILEVKEDSKTQHLVLKVLMYDEFKVQIVLEVYRQSELKLVNAQWITKPVVYEPCPVQNTDPYSLPMSSLDDLVEVAKTNLSPPHDVRFILRETCARVRIHRNRVQDLSLLRKEVLTKVVGSDQVVCSLNDGIVIVMRLYDNLVRAEQIVGVTGWDETAADKILNTIRKNESINLVPSAIIEIVRSEVDKLRQGGKNPRTPKLPKRRDASEQGRLL